MRVGLTGLTMAEHFRDQGGKDVLLFIDNIFRFTQAGSEVSALLGRMPSAVGYQPTLQTEMGALQERMRARFGINVLGVRRGGELDLDITPQTVFGEGESVLVLGRERSVRACFGV